MLWRPGDIFLDEVELRVPVTATAPAILRAQFELYNAGSGDIQASVDAQGRPGAPLYDGSTLLPIERATPSPDDTAAQRADIARFGDLALLNRFHFSSNEISAGRPLTLTLEWITLGQADRDLTLFAQLIDQAGQVVAQHDKPPLDGQFPTTRWQAGILFTDQHVIQLPADLAPGVYRIALGFYDAATGGRLPVAGGAADQAGAAWQIGADHVLLGNLTAR
jgi:hypothetical protein